MKICLIFGKAGALEITVTSMTLRTYGERVVEWNLMMMPLEVAMREASSHVERLLREGKT
jgi:hypothetical protein